MAWNVWGEPNYISLEGNRVISSIIVFFSPYFMPLLFVLAGVSTKYALQKRSNKEYVLDRVKRLLIPCMFGTVVLMPVMTYIADRFNFSFGQFWFLLYLFIVSLMALGIISISKKTSSKEKKEISFWFVCLLGLPLPLLSELLSIGGKSLVEFTYLFMLGYYVFTDENITNKAKKNCWLLLSIGLVATILNVYLFIWCDKEYAQLNTITKYVSEWIMIIALIGLAKKYLNYSGNVSSYMNKRSFLFYIYHFIWVVLSQYILHGVAQGHNFILFAGTVSLAYGATFICCEISIRIPFLCALTGTKYGFNK